MKQGWMFFNPLEYHCALKGHVKMAIEYGLREYRRRLAVRFEEYLKGNLLDVGCGDGLLWDLDYFSKIVKYLVGVDVQSSTNWIKIKKENMDYMCCDVRYLPFRSESFNVVFIKDVLHHVDDPQRAFNEILRSSNDRIILVEANRYDPVTFVHMTLARGHDHFSLRKLKQLVRSRTNFAIFLQRESHFYPLRSVTLFKLLWALEDIAERIPVLRDFLSYNIALITKQPISQKNNRK